MPQFIRKPYAEKFIRDLKQGDIQIVLAGMIISKTDQDFFLDDGTGQIRCIFEHAPDYAYLRVFGTLIPVAGEGFTVQVDFVQDFSTIDKQLYQRLKKLLS
ncbi:MAG: hypothetical protein AABX86_01070 [Nanoarchaeota archaeon]